MGEEGVEERVVVVGKPEADVAGIEVSPESVEGVLLKTQEIVERVLPCQIGIDIHLFLGIENGGERGVAEPVAGDGVAWLGIESSKKREKDE